MGNHDRDAVDVSGDSVDSGADAMTFDMKVARQLCGPEIAIKRFRGTYCGCPVVEDSFFFGEDQFSSFTIKNDPALSERLGKLHDVFPKALDKIDAQARRIRGLEGDAKNWKQAVCDLKSENREWREYNLQLDRKNRKLHAALKKLGEAKRERGKALVEERAQWNAICRDVGADPSDRYCTGEGEDGYPEARRQLHQEKLL